MENTVRVDDGRGVPLGDDSEVADAMRDIMDASGGSSGRGRFSYLFGLPGNEALSVEEAARLGQEAAEFRLIYCDVLQPETVALLDRVASLYAPQGNQSKALGSIGFPGVREVR